MAVFDERIFESVDITDDYMFSTVMQDPEICTELLEYLLPDHSIQRLKYRYFNDDGTEIEDPATVEKQKTLPGYFGYRGVRLDAYVDDGRTIYNIELQTTSDSALPQRCRLYQSHIDISQLRRGTTYDNLRPSYVIFICKFDPFGDDFYRYTFQNQCGENLGRTLGDGAYKLFFNTTGHVGEISPRLRELLEYMNNPQTYPVSDTHNDLIHKLDRAVDIEKMRPEWRDRYMIYQIKQREAEIRGETKGRAEGLAEGRAEGKKETAIETARRMLLRTMSPELIAEVSGLTPSEVMTLKAQMAQ